MITKENVFQNFCHILLVASILKSPLFNVQKCLPGSGGQADSGLNLDLTEP